MGQNLGTSERKRRARHQPGVMGKPGARRPSRLLPCEKLGRVAGTAGAAGLGVDIGVDAGLLLLWLAGPNRSPGASVAAALGGMELVVLLRDSGCFCSHCLYW